MDAKIILYQNYINKSVKELKSTLSLQTDILFNELLYRIKRYKEIINALKSVVFQGRDFRLINCLIDIYNECQ